jgi:hypothetical protein
MNRRMPNGTYGGVRGWGRKAPAYSIVPGMFKVSEGVPVPMPRRFGFSHSGFC